MEFTDALELSDLVSKYRYDIRFPQPVDYEKIEEQPVEKIFSSSPNYKDLWAKAFYHREDEKNSSCSEKNESENVLPREKGIRLGSESFTLTENKQEFTGADSSRVKSMSRYNWNLNSSCPIIKNVEESSKIAREILNNIVEQLLEEIEGEPPRYRMLSDQSVTMGKYRKFFLKEENFKRVEGSPSILTKLLNESRSIRSSSTPIILPPSEMDKYRKKLTVYLLRTKKKIEISVSKNNTILQIIQHVFSLLTTNCENEEGTSISPVPKLPYPTPEAYELKVMDDDEIMEEIPALDPNDKLKQYDLEAVAFCAKKNVNLKKEMKEIEEQKNFLAKVVKLENKYQKIGFSICLAIGNNSSIHKVGAGVNDTLKDLFAQIVKKMGLDIKEELCVFRPFNNEESKKEDPESLLNYNVPLNLQNYDMTMPVRLIPTRALLLTEKIFFDLPKNGGIFEKKSTSTQANYELIKQQAMRASKCGDGASDISEEDLLYSDVTAAQYQEFEIYKISDRGGLEPRLLGVDKNFIYNAIQTKECRFMNTMLPQTLAKIAKTATPIIPLKSVKSATKETNPLRFTLCFVDKKITYKYTFQSQTKNAATIIVAKINFLLRDANKGKDQPASSFYYLKNAQHS